MKKILSSLTVICFLLSGNVLADINEIPFVVGSEENPSPITHEAQYDDLEKYINVLGYIDLELTDLLESEIQEFTIIECLMMSYNYDSKECKEAGIEWQDYKPVFLPNSVDPSKK